MNFVEQAIVLFSGINGFLDRVKNVAKFEKDFINFMYANKSSIMKEILEKKAISNDIISELKTIIPDFVKNYNL